MRIERGKMFDVNLLWWLQQSFQSLRTARSAKIAPGVGKGCVECTRGIQGHCAALFVMCAHKGVVSEADRFNVIQFLQCGQNLNDDTDTKKLIKTIEAYKIFGILKYSTSRN